MSGKPYAAAGDIERSRCKDKRHLINPLVVPWSIDGIFTGKYNHWHTCGRRRRERSHDLRQARPTGDRCNTCPAARHRVCGRHCDCAMLVTGMNTFYIRIGCESGLPVHVAISGQAEESADTLSVKRLCDGLIYSLPSHGTPPHSDLKLRRPPFGNRWVSASSPAE